MRIVWTGTWTGARDLPGTSRGDFEPLKDPWYAVSPCMTSATTIETISTRAPTSYRHNSRKSHRLASYLAPGRRNSANRPYHAATATGHGGNRDRSTPLQEPHNAHAITRDAVSLCKSSVIMQVPMLS